MHDNLRVMTAVQYWIAGKEWSRRVELIHGGGGAGRLSVCATRAATTAAAARAQISSVARVIAVKGMMKHDCYCLLLLLWFMRRRRRSMFARSMLSSQMLSRQRLFVIIYSWRLTVQAIWCFYLLVTQRYLSASWTAFALIAAFLDNSLPSQAIVWKFLALTLYILRTKLMHIVWAVCQTNHPTIYN